MKKIYLLIISTILLQSTFAQVTGVKTIPGDYASIALAFTDLNTNGVGAGGATLNVAAGYTETAPAGGFNLGTATLNASLSAANPLIIQKNGAGANPLITSQVGTSTNLDGVFKFSGVDYMTITSIDLVESAANTNATTVMEWGYGFFNLNSAAPFDGCNNNTIQNCTVTLKRTVATPSKGIFMAHQTAASTTLLLPTATADMNNNNKFYGNTLTNMITAIYIGGTTSANDVGNDLGGSSAATGNTMTNVIGALYSSIGAVTATYQTNCNISYNSINNLANGGTNSIATSWGIYAYGPNCTFTVSNNTVTLTEASISTAYAVYGIYGNAGGANITATNNTVTISEISGSAVNNIAIFLPNGSNTTISGNTVTQNMALSGTTYGIYITSTGTVVINANTVKQVSSVVTTSQFYSIVSGGTSTTTESITNNVFDNTSVAVAGTLSFVACIYTVNLTANKTITGNRINGALTINSGSDTYFILNNPAGSIGAGTATIANNDFSNVTKSGAGSLYGIYYAPTGAGSQNRLIYNNTFSNLTSGTGQLVPVYMAAGGNDSVYNNSIHNLASAASIYSIYSAAPAIVNLKVFNNKIYSNASSSTGAITNTGITIAEATTATVFNNFIADLTAPAANNTGAVIAGIRLLNTTANTTANAYYNSINLNASSTGANFGTAGIFHTASATATTNNLTMIDNNIVNTSTANGTGVTAAYYRSSTALGNYNANSNNNNLYAGTPSATKLIFYDGTNADQTLTAYKTRVAPIDNNSLSVLPVFTSTTDLHLLASSNCSLESAGKPITGFTTDIDNNTRNTTTPDIGADEFVSTTAATSVTLAAATKTGLIPTCTENGWTYYVDPSFANQYLFAIEWDPTNLGLNASAKSLATVNITVDPAYYTVNDNSIPWGTWTMRRYWNVNLNGGVMTDPVNVRFFYDATEKTTIDAQASTFATTYTGLLEPATWFKTKVVSFAGDAAHMDADGVYNAIGLVDVNAGPALTINGVLYAQFNSMSSISGGTYATGVGPSTPLPITLNYLRGVKQGDKNNLSWKVTCNSTPKATLTLERSSGATNFTSIYTITADALRCQQPFDHQDANPLAGRNYYRLKMVDNNGKTTYSNIITLLNSTKGFEVMNIAPNPVTNGQFKLNVTSAENTKLNVVIIDMQGRIVQKQTMNMVAGYNSLDMNVINLASGTYNIYGTTDADKSKVIRFVKQ